AASGRSGMAPPGRPHAKSQTSRALTNVLQSGSHPSPGLWPFSPIASTFSRSGYRVEAFPEDSIIGAQGKKRLDEPGSSSVLDVDHDEERPIVCEKRIVVTKGLKKQIIIEQTMAVEIDRIAFPRHH